MNDAQQLYFNQASSDYAVFAILHAMPVCHQLHYLQMSTEKLGKAYFYGKATPPAKSHKGFVKFLRALPTRNNIWTALGFARRDDLESYINAIVEIAEEIEKLAPVVYLAGTGPNPEYPWPPPPAKPANSPLTFAFPIWDKLRRTGRGMKFQDFLQNLLQVFPEWF